MQTGAATLLQELMALKANFSAPALARKLLLLQQPAPPVTGNATLLKNYHECLLFVLAYPGNRKIYTAALQQLQLVTEAVAGIYNSNAYQQQHSLNGSGIIATETVCTFSFEMAQWLLANFGKAIGLHSSSATPEKISRVFEQLLPKMEYQQITQSAYGLQQRIQKLTGQKNSHYSLQWLLHTLQQNIPGSRIRNYLYDELEVFISWQLNHVFFNRSYLRGLPLQKIQYTITAAAVKDHARYIRKKINGPLPVTAAGKKQLLDTARAALALHYRETDPVTFGDSNTVTYFNMGHGISIALYSMQPQQRFSIESYVGYMAFVNGVPAAYGGGWLLGQRCKIGINIFPALRGGNSSLLFAAILRLYHQYYHAQRFVVKPYQFGKNNADGLRSGAFWFYYKLGFRPATIALQQLAQQENAKKMADKKYRTPVTVLQQFTAAPVELLLHKNAFPAYDGGEISKAITQKIIQQFAGNRQQAAVYYTTLLKKLSAASGIQLSAIQKKQLLQQWPWMALVTGGNTAALPFTKKETAQFIRLLLSKFNTDERDYILALQQHKKLWKLLMVDG